MNRQRWCLMISEIVVTSVLLLSFSISAADTVQSDESVARQEKQIDQKEQTESTANKDAETTGIEQAVMPEQQEPSEPFQQTIAEQDVQEKEQVEQAPPVIPQENRIEDVEEKADSEQALDSALNVLDKRGAEQAGPEVEQEHSAEKVPDEFIEFQFENTDLKNVINQVSDLFDVSFVTDDAVEPMPQLPGMKPTKGMKISYRNHKPLAKKEAWNLFLTLLDIAGFGLINTSDPACYRVVSTENARKSALPAFIGVDLDTLPDNDQFIRYVYFIENSSIEVITKIVDALKSQVAILVPLSEVKAIVLTDKAYNVKMLMHVVKELDKATMPQEMAVLKLRSADAEDVRKLYEDLTKPEAETGPQRFPTARKSPTTLYFPDGARVIAEPRSNSLILLGTREAIERIENFVKRYIDKEPDKPYSPLHIYHLKYANAATVANIMNEMAKFGKDTAAGKAGGVRSGNKYLGQLDFVPEPITNSLIVRGSYEDFLSAKQALDKIDEKQPQIVIEVLLVAVTLNTSKQLGAQIRTKQPNFGGLLGNNIKFQTSGLYETAGIQENPDATKGSERLLADLVALAKGAAVGNTIFTLGNDLFGVWGILSMLETVSDTNVISNPFMIATNKQPAQVTVGEIRRVVTSTVVSSGNSENAFGNDDASLSIKITPQINSDGMILLDINFSLQQFTPGSTSTNVAKTIRSVLTKAVLSNNEVLAIGGLIQNREDSSKSKFPVLGDLPLVGWLWKNRADTAAMGNLLLLVSTHILDPKAPQDAAQYTQIHVEDYYNMLGDMEEVPDRRDPIYRWFFKPPEKSVQRIVETHLLEKGIQIPQKQKIEKVAKVESPVVKVQAASPQEQKEMQWHGKPGTKKRGHRTTKKRSKVSLDNEKKESQKEKSS